MPDAPRPNFEANAPQPHFEAIVQAMDQLSTLIEELQREALPTILRGGGLGNYIGDSTVAGRAEKTEEATRPLAEQALRERLESGQWPEMTSAQAALVHLQLMNASRLLSLVGIFPFVSYIDTAELVWRLCTKGWTDLALPYWRADNSRIGLAYEEGMKQGREQSFCG